MYVTEAKLEPRYLVFGVRIQSALNLPFVAEKREPIILSSASEIHNT